MNLQSFLLAFVIPLLLFSVQGNTSSGLNWQTCFTYIDDIIIYPRNFDAHLHHLEDMFLRQRKAHISLKPSKCFFVQDYVKYLGHIVSRDGIRPNPDKVSAVTDFPVPKNTQREYAVSWVWPTTTDDLYRVSPNLLPLSINSCANKFV